MNRLAEQITLLHPWSIPASIAVAAVVVLLLWLTGTRRRPLVVQLLLVGVGVLTTVLCWWLIDKVWIPVADGIGWFVWWWLGALGLVLAMVVAGPWRRRGWIRRAIGGLAAVLVTLLAGMVAVNAHFSTYTTLSQALGLGIRAVPMPEHNPHPQTPQTGPITSYWRPPAGMPATGELVQSAIPSSDPRFQPRPGYVYLPPAYRTEQRPLLPVLVLLAGQPGGPEDWLNGGRLQQTMDAFAAKHNGLAPVVLIVDPLGSPVVNPLCSDATEGKVATYLQQDVPAWVTKNLQVDPDHRHWAIGGISNGGTCSMQVVTRAPEVFPIFLNISGEAHPTLGSPSRTLEKGYGGNRALMDANDPATLMRQRSYPEVAGIVSVGREDTEYLPIQQGMYAATKAAGMDTQFRDYPGKHSWTMWATAFEDQLPWLAERTGITGVG